ncbi:uncharacterized protein LOC143742515 isoform X1 [Siphateles boraxobius]|uniref:uncharacterized protein LOC143742515 isoform X1 n=1 Tax=Siphateles boraxobius TaxID=180520 RepID=UPI004063EE63
MRPTVNKNGKRLYSADQSLHPRYVPRHVCRSVIRLATKTREWEVEAEKHIGGNFPKMRASCGRGLIHPHKLLPWLQVFVDIAEADGDLLRSTDVLGSIHYEGVLQYRAGVGVMLLQPACQVGVILCLIPEISLEVSLLVGMVSKSQALFGEIPHSTYNLVMKWMEVLAWNTKVF